MITKLLIAALFAFGLVTAAEAAPELNDAQIAHIAYTADQIDITAAKQALKKSHNAKVISFAKEMMRDHSAVNKQALALVKKLGIKPENNAVSRSLEENARAEHAKLSRLHGATYDRAYIKNEVAYHKEVIAAVKDTLIPATRNAQLRDFLKQGVAIFTGHLRHAEMIAKQVK